MKTKTAVIEFPGSNCIDETERFLYSIFDTVPTRVWHKEGGLPDADFFVLPGGFSYGDYVDAGMMAALCPLMEDLKAAAADGKKILGICNGFQILCRLGLLPGTLQLNESGRFVCKPVSIKDKRSGHEYVIPVAHGVGNYYSEMTWYEETKLKGVRPAFQYMDNPNGSTYDIAGVYNEPIDDSYIPNVLGMMPHPERAFESYHVSQDGPKAIWQLMISPP